jgi:protein-S-isoprenylcysteine O-methyltransferase Ste14
MTFISLLFVTQIILGLYLLPEIDQNEIAAYIGASIYSISGLVFGMLPVFELRTKGGIQEGRSYVNTTKLVDTGIYSIVRHPQYLTWIMWAIAGMFLFQHWTIILLGIPIIPLTYIDMMREEKGLIKKFGDEYQGYMRTVPRANFILGVVRSLRRRKLDG